LNNQKWYIECKRHAKSLGWPTVWEKIAFSDAAVADFLLIFTNSNPSPQCETEIQRWNTSKRYPKIRIWRGYDLRRILQQYPAVATKYRLFVHPEEEPAGFLPLVLACTKIIQAAYVAYEFGTDGKPSLEAAAAVCELLASKMSDRAVYGRLVHAPTDKIGGSYYPWMTIPGDIGKLNDTSLRAVATVLKYVTGSASVSVRVDGFDCHIEGIDNKLHLMPSACRLLGEIAVWAN
jgi:hypothetical protein